MRIEIQLIDQRHIELMAIRPSVRLSLGTLVAPKHQGDVAQGQNALASQVDGSRMDEHRGRVVCVPGSEHMSWGLAIGDAPPESGLRR